MPLKAFRAVLAVACTTAGAMGLAACVCIKSSDAVMLKHTTGRKLIVLVSGQNFAQHESAPLVTGIQYVVNIASLLQLLAVVSGRITILKVKDQFGRLAF